jgi:hypothetical protein
MVLLMKRHMKPLNSECVVGLGAAPRQKGFGRSKHLFEPLKVIEWRCHHWLLEDIVSTRLKVDVLPISRLFFVQRPLKKELKSTMEVLPGVAILFAWNWPCCVDRIWKMLVERLLPGSPVLPLEHIFKLRKGINPGEVTLFCPFVKLGDRLIDGEFNRVLTIILVDCNSTFVLGIVTLQLVDFGEFLIVIPRFNHPVDRQALVDGCHRVTLVALCG